jgi:hypothetical protein
MWLAGVSREADRQDEFADQRAKGGRHEARQVRAGTSREATRLGEATEPGGLRDTRPFTVCGTRSELVAKHVHGRAHLSRPPPTRTA